MKKLAAARVAEYDRGLAPLSAESRFALTALVQRAISEIERARGGAGPRLRSAGREDAA
jgi:hypothetical protein